ncbi:MAG TPA: hypothetical protein ENH89_23725 [Aurantimonas coralicida]|uniref:Uncharacterized protein n=1 Tax=Aurantimonas coralicida TaxID=182270 RepID=A0A9C9NKB2_9HYPH|nr:hypothetical protein [Aurantimonas coralicida]
MRSYEFDFDKHGARAIFVVVVGFSVALCVVGGDGKAAGMLGVGIVAGLWLLIALVASKLGADSITQEWERSFREARFIADWFHEQRTLRISQPMMDADQR